MATVSDAINIMTLTKSPVWWLKKGDKLVGRYVDGEDMDASTSHLTTVLSMQPEGAYTLKYTTNKDNHKGALDFSFTNSTQPAAMTQPQTPLQTANPHNLTDAQYQKLREEIRREYIMEQMFEAWSRFEKDWPKYKALIDKHEEFLLKDSDNDGEPDFLESAKKVSETLKHGSEAVSTLGNLNLFGR